MSSPVVVDERGSRSQRGLTVIMRREEVGGTKWEEGSGGEVDKRSAEAGGGGELGAALAGWVV